jgi:hypothetical protein
VKALAKGLMGAAQGALGGLYNAWQTEQQDIRTERLLAARRLEAQQLAAIQAEYANAKDAKDHEQAKELEGIRSEARAEQARELEEGRDRRSAESREAADKRNRDRIEAADRRPRGSSTPPSKKLFEDRTTGEQKWLSEDDPIPSGYFRVSARSKPPEQAKPKPAAPKLSGGLTDPSSIPAGAVIAGRSPDGKTVYRTPDGELWTAD